MSLQKVDLHRTNVPKNAVLLSEDDAIDYQWKLLRNWPIKSEVWAFKYGISSLIGAAGFTGLYIGRYYRRKLKLQHYGYITTLLSTVVSASFGAGFLHVEFVMSDVLLEKTPCPVCVQTRASLLQISSGVIYPLIISPILSAMIAVRIGVRMPYYTEWRELAKLWSKVTKPLAGRILLLIAFHGLMATGVTYYEAQQVYNIQEKLLIAEKDSPNRNK
ncbi:uncharacterized protein LOC122510033 isoform X1 [Leptopilina heterotoma]|uniref:uncharacterized protein LOC122510033 isoform X1 n=1 Tax=Leptopilina heterotoma TaxID=63436 RepID=UPI001CA9819D|nr:uncharacterized protein LOC122510033 isoform X1 [Leptopilina heterotoma]